MLFCVLALAAVCFESYRVFEDNYGILGNQVGVGQLNTGLAFITIEFGIGWRDETDFISSVQTRTRYFFIEFNKTAESEIQSPLAVGFINIASQTFNNDADFVSAPSFKNVIGAFRFIPAPSAGIMVSVLSHLQNLR
jgi:hypothetical protein